MKDWKDDLSEAIEAEQQEQYRYTITLPQVAKREFYNLAQWLHREVEVLNKKHEATKGRVDVIRAEDDKIEIHKNDWPSYHFSLTLTPDGKQLQIDCSNRRSQSDNRTFRPIILKLDMDTRNELHIFRDGQEIGFEDMAKMIFTPLYSGTDFR